jgi:hypothetical protein
MAIVWIGLAMVCLGTLALLAAVMAFDTPWERHTVGLEVAGARGVLLGVAVAAVGLWAVWP